MKKVLALALALVMMLAIAIPAFAEEPNEGEAVVGGAEPEPENVISQDFTSETAGTVGNSKVEYGVSQAYTVTIPNTVSFTTLKDIPAEVSASNVLLAGNEKLVVTVVSAKTFEVAGPKTVNKTAWTMVDTNGISTPVDYWLALEAQVDKATTAKHVADNGVVLEVLRAAGNNGVEGATGSADLFFSTNGTAQEGTYEDRLTFNVAIAATTAEYTYQVAGA